MCGMEPVRLRRGSGAAGAAGGSAGEGRPARSRGGGRGAELQRGAVQVLTGLAPGWSGPRSKTRLTRYLAG